MIRMSFEQAACEALSSQSRAGSRTPCRSRHPAHRLVPDDFPVARVEAFFAQQLKPGTAAVKNDPPPSGIVVDDDPVEPPQPTGLVSNIAMATLQIDPQPMNVTPLPTRNVDADDTPPRPKSPTVSPPSSPKPIAIDDSNPAANILRSYLTSSRKVL